MTTKTEKSRQNFLEMECKTTKKGHQNFLDRKVKIISQMTGKYLKLVFVGIQEPRWPQAPKTLCTSLITFN